MRRATHPLSHRQILQHRIPIHRLTEPHNLTFVAVVAIGQAMTFQHVPIAAWLPMALIPTTVFAAQI